MKRKNTREEAVKLAYGMDISHDFSMEALSRNIESFGVTNVDMEYLNKTLRDIMDHEEEIDALVTENSKGWKLSRIAKVDLAVLRVALAEILYNDSIPESVSINEAVEISKKYSNDDSHKFINGILGTVVRSMDK